MRRLLCDGMLAGLARWLRAAGHDAALAAPGEPDARLLEHCRADSRVLLTRDRRLAGRAAPTLAVVQLDGNDAEADAVRLARALDLDWTFAPFTRCMV